MDSVRMCRCAVPLLTKKTIIKISELLCTCTDRSRPCTHWIIPRVKVYTEIHHWVGVDIQRKHAPGSTGRECRGYFSTVNRQPRYSSESRLSSKVITRGTQEPDPDLTFSGGSEGGRGDISPCICPCRFSDRALPYPPQSRWREEGESCWRRGRLSATLAGCTRGGEGEATSACTGSA